jgi:hypothetical protein
MGKVLFVLASAIFFAACHKEPVQPQPGEQHPEMIYKDLQNAEVKYLRGKAVDVDGDGSNDFLFHVQLVGDPVLQRDRVQFYVSSGIDRNLLNDDQDQSPVLNKMDVISRNVTGYTWWEISAIVLAEKIITYTESHWEGAWKNADHKYLPVQMKKQGKLYHGWIELSFNTTEEKLILHRSAISKEEDKDVKAGL